MVGVKSSGYRTRGIVISLTDQDQVIAFLVDCACQRLPETGIGLHDRCWTRHCELLDELPFSTGLRTGPACDIFLTSGARHRCTPRGQSLKDAAAIAVDPCDGLRALQHGETACTQLGNDASSWMDAGFKNDVSRIPVPDPEPKEYHCTGNSLPVVGYNRGSVFDL